MELNYCRNFDCLEKIEVISVEEKDIKGGQITINIPSIIDGYKIDVIGSNAIEGFLFTSAEIKAKITSIKYNIEEGPQKIDNFQSSKIVEVTIPSSVVKIAIKSFCKTKVSISFKEDSQLSVIGEKAFADAKFQSELILPTNLKYIDDSAFMNADLSKGFSFNEQLKIIGQKAFQCALFETEKILKFPNSLKTIEDNAFEECAGISQIIFDKGTKIFEIGSEAFYFCPADFLQINEGEKTIILDNYCFSHMYNLEKVDIGFAKISELPSNCFSCCEELININLPKQLKAIHEQAFYGCKRLKSIIIPKFVSEIGKQAFYNCVLEVISLKCKNLHWIGDYAFASNNLKEIPSDIFKSLSMCGNNIFDSNLFEKIILDAPENEFCLGSNLFSRNYKLKTVEMINTTSKWTKIPKYMFQHCILLTSITMPESIWLLGEGCFFGTGLVDITLPAVTEINKYAFYNCSKLKTINLLNPNFKFCDTGAFSNCQALEKVNFNLFYSNIKADVFDNKIIAKTVLADNLFISIT